MSVSVANITRNNHFVPEATLRRWSDGTEYVWGYRLLVSHPGVRPWRRELLSRMTRQTDLYTLRTAGQDSDGFETYVTREFEEPGQRAIEQLVRGARVTQEAWRDIARFVVAQDLRTPLDFIQWLSRLRPMMQESLDSVVEGLEARLKGQVSDETLGKPERNRPDDELMADEATAIQVDEGDYIRQSLRVSLDRSASDGRLAVVAEIRSPRSVWIARTRHLLTNRSELVCRHHWCSMVPASGEEWPLTDHPVLRLNFNSREDYDFEGGWGNEGSEFFMPVAPRLAVYTQVGRRHPGPIHLDAAKTRLLQELLVERAHRWVLARQRLHWIEEFRPRKVNADTFEAEQKAWKRWHADQSLDETCFDEQTETDT